MGRKFKRWRIRMLILASVVGPGIIAGSANNDAGGISTYSYAGSRFGYVLLWVLVINLFTLACTQQMGVRLGVFTGKGLASLIRERFGVRWTLLAVLTLLAANMAVCASEFAGIAASLELFHVSKWISVPLLAIIVWFVLYKGSFRKIEKLFLLISALFLVYVVSAIMAKPDWSEVAVASVTPFLLSDKAFFLALLGIMGTTITPWGQFFIQSYVVDKGISAKNYVIEKWEVYFSAFFTCFIAAMIIVTTKNVLFDHGIVVDSAEKAAMSLAPILGDLAEIIFGFGFFAASLLGAFIIPLTTSYCVCEALGFEHGVDRKLKEAPVFYGLIAFMVLFAALFLLTSFFSLFQVMIFAQVVNGMLLPIILVFLIILFNSGKQLGLPPLSRVSSISYNVVTWAVIVCLIAVSLLLVAFTLFPSFVDFF
ncbi:MAG: Nramp family divalent metal transporter [Candidatus Magasanikbacteria bacterium]|nr:Nramp family divalent metal transporter [Candidatus Magasanikbacteria bacterium]